MMMATLNETPSVEPAAYAGLSSTMWRYVGIAAILAIASKGYETKADCQKVIDAIKRDAAKAKVNDQAK